MASKKGMESSWTAMLGILLLLLGGVVLLIFIGGAGKIAVSAAEKDQCIASVRAQAAAGLMSPYASVNLRCSTNHKTVTESDPTKQKQVIATEMANCWEQFGEGKLKLFAVESGVPVTALGEHARNRPYGDRQVLVEPAGSAHGARHRSPHGLPVAYFIKQ